MSGAGNCPECGARVSGFAAGCAVCGADLEAHHRRARLAAQAEAREPRRRRMPDLPRPSLSPLEAVYLAVTVFCVLWISVLGIVLGLLGALHGYYENRWGLLLLFAALAALALGLETAQI